MEFFNLIQEAFDVKLEAFVLVTVAVLIVVAAARAGVVGTDFAQAGWFKCALSIGACVFGIGFAFLAQAAGIYHVDNWAAVIFIGIFNGTLASTGWQVFKRVGAIRQLVNGSDKP